MNFRTEKEIGDVLSIVTRYLEHRICSRYSGSEWIIFVHKYYLVIETRTKPIKPAIIIATSLKENIIIVVTNTR
jgi:hypothetical protein